MHTLNINSVLIGDNLEVTGISRSGRVRKKSSKLSDFRTNYDTESANQLKRSHASKIASQKSPNIFTAEYSAEADDVKSGRAEVNEPIEFSDELNLLESDSFHYDDDEDDDDEDEDDDELLMALDSDQLNDYDTDRDGSLDTTVRQSVYMTEKTTRKKVFKDGRIVLGRLQRKDKGKPRFTSYMLWAREMRQDMLNSNPNLDFATQSRRLSEMWANMPPCDKFNWRRKAKRLAVTKKADRPAPASSAISQPTAAAGSATSKFLNKSSNPSPIRRPGRPPKLKKPGRKPKMATSIIERPQIKTKNRKMKVELKAARSPKKLAKKGASITSAPPAPVAISNKSNQHTNNKSVGSPVTPGPYRVTGLGPTEVAAHLKLLGDNLTIIGERLKEHEVSLDEALGK